MALCSCANLACSVWAWFVHSGSEPPNRPGEKVVKFWDYLSDFIIFIKLVFPHSFPSNSVSLLLQADTLNTGRYYRLRATPFNTQTHCAPDLPAVCESDPCVMWSTDKPFSSAPVDTLSPRICQPVTLFLPHSFQLLLLLSVSQPDFPLPVHFILSLLPLSAGESFKCVLWLPWRSQCEPCVCVCERDSVYGCESCKRGRNHWAAGAAQASLPPLHYIPPPSICASFQTLYLCALTSAWEEWHFWMNVRKQLTSTFRYSTHTGHHTPAGLINCNSLWEVQLIFPNNSNVSSSFIILKWINLKKWKD